MNIRIKRGDVIYVRLTGAEGSEQESEEGLPRPCVVIQNDTGNSNPGSKATIIVPITTSDAYRKIPVQVRLWPIDWAQAQEAGSVVECGQIRTVDQCRIVPQAKAASLSKVAMERIDRALKISIGLT